MNYVRKMFCQAILWTDDKPSFIEKVNYFINLITTLTPIAFLLDGLNLWFKTNHQFSSFVIICLVINLLVGARFHYKMNSFSWVEFFKKNSEMWIVLIVVYGLLEMLRLTAGSNFIGEGFKVLIQVMTLLYPISKVLKNIYILSRKRYPPAFIMEKIYNFEKTGDLSEFFNNDKK